LAPLVAALQALVELLRAAGGRGVVIGGVAASMHPHAATAPCHEPEQTSEMRRNDQNSDRGDDLMSRNVPMLKDRVVVITGASSGIGAAVAAALAAAGASVVLGARRADRLASVCERIRSAGGQADAVVTDLRQETDVEELIEAAVARHGRLDVLVNNAAMGTVRTIAEGRSEEWRAILETNILGTLIACRAALRHMLRRGRGDILNVTSASADEAWPYLSVYAASKAAVHSLSRGLRAEVAERGIRVMTIEIHNVGGTDFATSFDPELLAEALQRWKDLGLLNPRTPMLTADDVARAVIFQLSQPDPTSIHHLTVRSRAN
jgi:NADP-dependent 3-hydroxy acid dehydrogenase YdfG